MASPRPDAKSVLQEWAQGRRLPLPRYIEIAREGPDHAPRFTAEVQIDGVAPGARPRRATSAQPSRPRRSPCCCARGSGRLPPMTEAKGDDQRCGFVALIGAPNSGKSTLINALVGAKVAIVTQKAQTTRGAGARHRLEGRSQIILVDTPGIFQPKRRLDRAMSGAAWTRAARSRSRGAGDRRRTCAHGTRARRLRSTPYSRRSPPSSGPSSPCSTRSTSWRGPSCCTSPPTSPPRHAFDAHLHDLGAERRRRSRPQGLSRGRRAARPWLYPEDQLTDAPLRQAAAEITREKLFLQAA